MRNVLLISEDTVKTYSGLNDNIWGKSLLPAIREAQEIGLQGIIGSCLYQSLCSKVADGSIENQDNIQYKTLLDEEISYYMIYKVISDLVPVIGRKARKARQQSCLHCQPRCLFPVQFRAGKLLYSYPQGELKYQIAFL